MHASVTVVIDMLVVSWQWLFSLNMSAGSGYLASMLTEGAKAVAVVVEWLACLPVTQKIGVRFYLERESATSG